MPTQAYFNKYPAFPSEMAVIDLPVLSFSKLLAKDEIESNAVFEASRSLGFFLLDFQGCEAGEAFLKSAEQMFDLGEEVHMLPKEELMKYAYNPPFTTIGYKHAGHIKIEDGRPDRFEFYAVGRDDIMGVSEQLPSPECIKTHRGDIKRYLEQANSVLEVLWAILERQLRLAPGTFTKLNSITSPSGTALRMLRYEPQPPGDQRTSLVGHNDIGSMTILFNIMGGLQLLPPNADPTLQSSWYYIKPQPNCCIINFGDAMVEWTGGILRSNMHRVTFAPGEQGKIPRYSLAYLARPDGTASMKRLSGGGSLIPELEEGEEDNLMSSKEWEKFRSAAIQAGHDNARSRGGKPLKKEVVV